MVHCTSVYGLAPPEEYKSEAPPNPPMCSYPGVNYTECLVQGSPEKPGACLSFFMRVFVALSGVCCAHLCAYVGCVRAPVHLCGSILRRSIGWCHNIYLIRFVI